MQTHSRKPASLIYAVDEPPPLLIALMNASQHVALVALFLIFPLLVFRVAGLPELLIANLLAISTLALGVGTLLQAMRIGPLGSGYLCPTTFTAAYLGPSLLAVKTGGLPLLFGMTVFAGTLEAALSRLLDRMRPLLPPELAGIVIFLIGWSAGIAALRTLLGTGAAPLRAEEFWISLITLSTMVGLHVWAGGIVRMLCALIGLVTGYAAAAAFGMLEGDRIAIVLGAPWVGLPGFDHLSWSFDAALAVPFAVASIAVAMKAIGTLTICQRMNDADWVRLDMKSATRGVFADGVATMVSGGLGSIGTTTSAGSVGVAAATGVGSRRVAYLTGVTLLVLALLPKLATLLAIMPRSVMTAALLFAVAFIIINGLQVMTSRLLDARRTLVIGLSIVAGGAVEVFPQLGASAPQPLASLFSSSIALATTIALLLNLLFRIGSKRTVTLVLQPGEVDPESVETFFEQAGRAWGARPDVVSRATFAMIQLLDIVQDGCWRTGPIEIKATFDEFNLNVHARYEGEPIEVPARRPADREIVSSEHGARLLGGFMLRRSADQLHLESMGGTVDVFLHYDH